MHACGRVAACGRQINSSSEGRCAWSPAVRRLSNRHSSNIQQVTGHTGQESLGDSLAGADLVVIPAGVPRKPGMTRDDLFNINAGIVKTLAEGIAKHCPQVRTVLGALPTLLFILFKAALTSACTAHYVVALNRKSAVVTLADATLNHDRERSCSTAVPDGWLH